MMQKSLFLKLFGISITQGTRGPKDDTTIDFAKLFGKARATIKLVSGKLLPSVYLSDIVVMSIESAIKRGVTIEVLTGPKSSKESIREWKARGAKIQILAYWPEKHFAIVDGKHVRIEVPHPETSTDCIQYIIYNYKFASKLDSYFASLKD